MTPELSPPLPSPRRSFFFPVVVALLFALGAAATLTFFGVIDVPGNPFARQKGGFRR